MTAVACHMSPASIEANIRDGSEQGFRNRYIKRECMANAVAIIRILAVLRVRYLSRYMACKMRSNRVHFVLYSDLLFTQILLTGAPPTVRTHTRWCVHAGRRITANWVYRPCTSRAPNSRELVLSIAQSRARSSIELPVVQAFNFAVRSEGIFLICVRVCVYL